METVFVNNGIELNKVMVFSPSGALIDEALLDRACAQLSAAGFQTEEMPETRLRVERFAGDESTRARSLEKAFKSAPAAILMASRGGYGLSRLLHALNFAELAGQLNTNGHVLSGHSDITSLQLALLNAGAKPRTLLHGPMACFDFGAEQGVDERTLAHFKRAVLEHRVEIQWEGPAYRHSESGALELTGPVWGGNLTLMCSLLGTPWMPKIQGGILVLEDVNEPAYKIERMLLQLLHAGVLADQQALVFGNFCEPKPGLHDNGYSLQSAGRFIQQQLRTVPVFMSFPFGHCTPKACWFQGGQGRLSARSDQTFSLTQNLR